MKYNKRAPFGVVPKFIHNEQRLDELALGIKRYINARYKLPVEWIIEYNELIK